MNVCLITVHAAPRLVRCLLALGVACAAGCATIRPTVAIGPAPEESVRNVDYREVPKMQEMAEHARRLGNEIYPKILALLVEDPGKAPAQFDIIFKSHLKPGKTGVTKNTRIYLDAREFAETPGLLEWFSKNATNLDAYAAGATNLQTVLVSYLDRVLVHEMAHVAEHYRGVAPIYWTDAPTHWEEGIADYVRFKLGYTNAWDCPQCSAAFPHYTSGYECAGALLLHLDATYGSNVVRRLNTELRNGSCSDDFFAQATGKNLDELWADFEKTPAVKPIAVELNKFRGAIGYKNGEPPGNVRKQAAAYLRQHADARKFYEGLGFTASKPHKGVQSAIEAYLYLKLLPGGDVTLDAMTFLTNLKLKGQLPGWSKKEHGQASFAVLKPGETPSYPVSRTLLFSKKGDHTTFNYTVERASEGGDWKLKRAWRVNESGRVIEEYPVR